MRLATQDHYALVTVWPGPKGQNLLEGITTYHNGIDACNKLVVTVGFAAALRQKVEVAVRSRNEAVEAGANKDRNYHRRRLTCGRLTRAYTFKTKSPPAIVRKPSFSCSSPPTFSSSLQIIVSERRGS